MSNQKSPVENQKWSAAKPGFSFKDWGIRAIQNTAPGWPPTAIDPSKAFKWQTRRVINERPTRLVWHEGTEEWFSLAPLYGPVKPPYGIGQLYYAKEALYAHHWADMSRPIAHYSADHMAVHDGDRYFRWCWKRDKQNGIFMPRAAARLFYVLRGIRAERLQDISCKECKAEGAAVVGGPTTPESEFAPLWNEINGPRSWHENPYVWVYEWERVEL